VYRVHNQKKTSRALIMLAVALAFTLQTCGLW